jgi:cold shock CspA family protein/ribosome-associated translation inhibitor RaiA
MQIPLQITFQDVERTESAEVLIARHAEKLERFSDRITSCRVVVSAPHRHQQRGRHFAVRVDITVPRKEIVVNRQPAKKDVHTRLEPAIRDAFATAVRRLEDYARRMRGDVKSHDAPPHGRVARVHPDEDFGFIEMPDGQQVYFHRHSLLDGRLEDLSPGTEVRFVLEHGEEGPNATSVRLGRGSA